ncbi:MAG: TetR/AcrR family transcriptional regulator [Flavipsychrobacter sp.]
MDQLQKILTSAVELFRQYGMKAITMDDIARRAGISKKTLYQHFANKNEVVNESVQWYKDQVCERCTMQMADSDNAIEGMVKMLAFMDEMNKQMNPMLLFEMQRYFPDAYKTFREQLELRDVGMLRDNIQRGIEEGLFRSEINPDLMARFRLESSLMILQPNLLVNDRNGLISVALEIGEHFMYGIMTQKGVKLYHKYKDKHIKQVVKS